MRARLREPAVVGDRATRHSYGSVRTEQRDFTFTNTYICFRSDMPCGLYPYDRNRQVYVSKGIGGSMRMRFFCAPELVIPEQK